ncbi:bifunctional 3'-5' exonuclease/DNA polymerase [Sinomonas sp. JGH33]|uniref:DNA-directed DNA polymerase n=1 Tax=Sinomonas terricola TaxID=3110330 RepID=A0ABU5T2B5_9MICC|nr:bifunctional 3'-5' exonuclease/DNA polymerase [Sinomonas sp. JGH33]MEA5453802.1 bifunctional 3'-5' exonuclease/DNA polymerase [Sinomonas sp. JGH33]
MHVILAPAPDGSVVLRRLDARGHRIGPDMTAARPELAREAERIEREERPRWVWRRAADWYPGFLAAGVRLERCHDLALCGAALEGSAFAAATHYTSTFAPRSEPTEPGGSLPQLPAPEGQGSLFEDTPDHGPDADKLEYELKAQLAAIAGATQPGRLRLLCAADSAGALVAAEMQAAGIPWDSTTHESLLAEQLGPRPRGLERPALLEEKANELREHLGAPRLNPDSPQELMRALHRAGIEARTTRAWELREFTHPAIQPLLEYKKLARLLAANGWAWLDAWVRDGRFRPEYVVAGVVTGRWASRGGGALQIPKQVRAAARALPGHKLVVADASQLEPRVLAALARDDEMAAAAQDADLYARIAAAGFGGDRAKAKVALLGAIYGATTGESGRLMPQLAKLYPRAVAYVEQAARDGERGLTVTTHLGRSSPRPSERWQRLQQSTTAEEQRRADAAARDRGRFTRNFVVQGTAAEWAECWMAELRLRLRRLAGRGLHGELVYFLHDEVMVHAEEPAAEACADAIREAAAAARRLLFGSAPVEFPVSIAVVDSYDQAK